MIRKIKSIKNFGVYNDYKWDQVAGIKDFKEKNIIYGWNYSGKTTISRIFSSMRKKKIHEKFKDGEFKIVIHDNVEISHNDLTNIPYDVHVFNSEYIKENLKWDSLESLDSISFDVGENVALRDQLKKNLEKIDRINGTEQFKSLLEKYILVINEFDGFDSKFTEESRRIKLDVFNSLIDFTKANFRTVKSSIESNFTSFVISNEEDLTSVKQMSLASNNKLRINPPSFNPKIKHLLDEVTLTIKHSPPKEEIIAVLEGNRGLYQWVLQGADLHKNLNDCSFCGQEIPENRINSLNNYFLNESSALRKKISDLKELLKKEKEEFFNIQIPRSKNDLTDKCQERYVHLVFRLNALKVRYEESLSALVKDLETKEEGNIFISMNISHAEDKIKEDIECWLVDLASLLEENNNFIENFSAEQLVARDKLKKHSVALYLITEKYVDAERAKNRANKYIKIYQAIIDGLNKENGLIMSKLKSIVAGKDTLDRYIKAFLGRNDIVIELTTDDRFMLKRGSRYADNLSEGEKTAISFAYFLVSLESLHKENKLKDAIVFIDDPISSLDANHIAQIYSLINSFFFRNVDPNDSKKVINCFKQLFISTHNFEFFSFLKDSSQIKKSRNNIPESGCEYYFIKREGINNSCFGPLPSRLHTKSEYIYLFELLYVFMKQGCPLDDEKYVLIPNALRRFFEIYTLIKLPGSESEIDYRLNKLMGGFHQLKVLHHFSHFTNFEKLTKHDELIFSLPGALDELMELLKKDTIHFHSLLEAIGYKEDIGVN